MALVVDTGPIIAGLVTTDEHHGRCRELLAGTTEPLVLPGPILGEVDFMLRGANPSNAFLVLLDDIRDGAYRVVDLFERDYSRVSELLNTYADLNLGFVDAAVFAIVERLGETKLATLDHRHFSVMRPRHCESLELLPA